MLKIENLQKSYGQFQVLRGLNMNVNKGDVYGFLGKNGCGKTTTMNIVSDIIRKDGGTVSFGKENCIIGYLPESPELFKYMNSYEYLDYIAACCNYKADRKKRIDEVISVVGMTEGGKRRIGGYSRGMNQRLGIAAAIFNHPDLLILDEPTSALDPQGRAEVMSIIKQLASSGTTIILCTHILSDVEKTANRIGIVRNGVMAVEGSISEICNTYGAEKKLKIKVFGEPAQAIATLSRVTGGKFLFEKTGQTFEIPMEKDEDEREKAGYILTELAKDNIVPSMFNIESKSLEQIYMETIG